MPKKPKKKSAAKSKAKTVVSPEWLGETPATTYTLEAGSDQIMEPLQTIELSLDEYETLKRHLARMRGIPVHPEAARA